jgi:hypothetical protein
VLKLAAAGTHVTVPESALDPFINWIAPVGPCELLLFEETIAVSVTLPPGKIALVLAVTDVAVAACVITKASVLLAVWGIKLLSPIG